MKRREFITLVGGTAVAWPMAARAQQPGKSSRIALIHPFAPIETLNEATNSLGYRFFFEELRRLGYVEGSNLVVERYSGLGKKTAQLAELLQTVSASRPDAIFVVAMDGVLAVTPVASPIVQVGLDPIAFGLTSNLAHPDRNITGVAITAGSELYAKHLELLRQARPTASRIACLTGREMWQSTSDIFGPLQQEARRSGIVLVPVLLESPYSDDEYRRVFAAMVQDHPDAMIVTQLVWNNAHQPLIVELAANARLPAIYPARSFVDQGGLMSYGSGPPEAFRRAANAIVEILKGARPSDIPFYQASRFELVVNLKTAKALDLTIPPLIMARVDDVIE
jgi:putative ABC transport system substrate-binding protein